MLKSSLFPSTLCLFAILLLVFPACGWAGGLWLNEFGTPSMGVAGAGSAAVASDASTTLHNPAGMTRISGKELMGSAGLIYSTVEFDPDSDTPVAGSDGGDAGSAAPLLGGFYTHSLNDRWKLGASVISLSGAALDYDDDWAGRYLNTEVQLLSLTFFPTVAYRVNDWLSLGGGPQIWYATLDMEIKAPPPVGTGTVEVDGDDVTYGFGLGALIEVSERTRFGIVYQSQVEPEFGGDGEFSGPVVSADAAVDTEITLARYIHISGYHELNDQWAILGTVGWENWSEFDNINLSTSAGSQKLPRNWDDTWKFAAGVHYRPAEKWLLQLGFAYDTNPVNSEDRTPDMPIDRQIRYATGVQYKWSEKLSTGAQFIYADFGEAKIRNSLLKGEYDSNNIFFLAFNVNYKF